MGAVERNRVSVMGAGARTFLLMHGLGWDQRCWRDVAAALAEDARVVLLDQVGAGGSDRTAYDPVRHDSLDGYAEDLREVIEAVGGPPPVLVGHSVGATLGVLVEHARPGTFAGMVLLAPSPRYLAEPGYPALMTAADLADFLDLMEANFLGWAATFAGMAAPQAEVARRLEAGLTAFDARVLRRFTELTLRSDIRAILPSIDVPTRIVMCAGDAIVPPALGELMAAAMPRARCHVVDVAGHFPHITHPALVVAQVQELAEALT